MLANVAPRTPLTWLQHPGFPAATIGVSGRWWRKGEVVEWLISTGRLPSADTDPWLGPAEVARMAGIATVTLRKRRLAGTFPEPEHRHGRRPLWRTSTVRRLLGADQ